MKVIILFLLLAMLPTVKANEVVFPEGVESGYVIFELDVSKEGKAINIEVIEEHPKGVFTESALKAIKQWTFKVRYIDGKAVKQENMTYKMEFVTEE